MEYGGAISPLALVAFFLFFFGVSGVSCCAWAALKSRWSSIPMRTAGVDQPACCPHWIGNMVTIVR